MKRFFFSFCFIYSLLMGQGKLIVNTSISDREFAIASIVQLHFNTAPDSLFIQTHAELSQSIQSKDHYSI